MNYKTTKEEINQTLFSQDLLGELFRHKKEDIIIFQIIYWTMLAQ